MYKSFRKTRGNRFLSIISALLILISLVGFKVQAQDDGQQLFQVCSACHTIGKGKLIGPDLQGVTDRLDRDWLKPFIKNSQEVIDGGDEYAVKQFEAYNKIPMPPNDLTDEQLDVLLDYITNYDPNAAVSPTAEAVSEDPTEQQAVDEFMAEKDDPYANAQISFYISLALILIALFDLIITRLIKAKVLHIMVIIISLVIIGEVVVKEAQSLGRQQYYSPDQPIAFSHKVHATDNKIDCQYCHFTVNESRHAGIPPMQLCLNCHNVVKSGTHTGAEEIAKIHASIESGKPVHWIKVHNLPDHVYFNHAQHVKVGKVDCEECHGDVAGMDRIMQIQDLSMGWCINCHRKTEVQFFDNDFYARYKDMHEKVKSGEISRITVNKIGGNDCQKCHY